MEIPSLNHHVGSTERVYIAHVNDLNDFYLQRAIDKDALLALGQELYEQYSDSLNKPSNHNQTLGIGDYCACPSESEDWYRGSIRQIDSEGHAWVYKVDYGDVQRVPMQCLQPLEDRFFQQPTLAFHCSLVNLLKPMPGWSAAVIHEFNNRLTTTFLYARFVYYNAMRHLSEVDLTEKASKTSFSKDFERYQEVESLIPIQDALIYKMIPMEELNLTESNAIRVLHYLSPSRFYVYLQEKVDSYIRFQKDLQQAVQSSASVPSPRKYQPIVVLDRDAIWHRAVILEMQVDIRKLNVYFLDIGLREWVPMHNIRSLPREFFSQPAVAIPCRLFDAHPVYANEPSVWKLDDAVHDEFHQVITNTVNCQVCDFRENLYYDVSIEISKIGDFGKFLSEKNLLSTQTMRGRGGFSSQGPSQDSGFVRTQLRAGGMNPTGLHQQPQLTRPPPMEQYQSSRLRMAQPSQPRFSGMGTRNPPVPTPRMLAPVPPPSSSSSSAFVQPESGVYLITQVHSAGEFYGCSQARERELCDLQNQLEDYYNRMGNDPSLSAGLIMARDVFVTLHDNIYQRVMIKNRVSDSRVLVQLLDRGDELMVDTSELLQIDERYKAVHAFAQPFCLSGYEDTQSSASLTRTLKQTILKQYVQISLQGPQKNGFYPVEVTLPGQQSLNQMLLSSGTNVMPPAPATRPNINPRPPALLESQTYSNSNRYQPNIGQNQIARAPIGQQRTSDLSNRLGTPVETTRPPAGRFVSDNQTAPNNMNPVNEVPPRFAQMGNRSLQQTSIRDSTAPTAPRNDESERTSNAPGGHGGYQTKIFQRQNYNSSQPNNNQRGDENLGSTNYSKQSEQRRPNDEPRFETPMNDRPMDNNDRRGGYQNRGDRESFNSRPNYQRNNDGQGSAPSDEYPRRSENYSHRGGRGDYNRPGQDRPNSYRNQNDDQEQNNSNDGRGEYSNRRGGYQNERGRGSYGGDNARRGDFRGGYRRGGGDRQDDGRSARGGNGNWDEKKNASNAETNESGKTFSGWSPSQAPAVKFEAGNSFPSIQIPKDIVQFVVSYIETPNDLFVQSISNEAAIVKLSENLQTDFKTAPEIDLKSAKPEQVCLAKSSDGCWYRAIVLSADANQMKVRFVDFGDTTDVNSSTARQLAKAHCSAAPYAYRCTFTDVTVAPNVKIDALNQRVAGERFQGKILSKISENQFVLESDQLKKILLETNALKLKPESALKRIPCAAVHFEPTEHRFYIQDDLETSKVIEDLVEKEVSTASTFSTDELGQLFNSKTIVIAPFDEDGFYRAIIQAEEADDQVKVYFVDFGNDSLCPKSVLQRCSEQLSSYAPQAKHCQLYGVSQNQLDEAFAFLQEKSDSDDIEVSIINEKENLLNVLVFIDKKCLNEQFGYNSAMLETAATETKPAEPSNQPAETKAEAPLNQQVETETAEPSKQPEKAKTEEPSSHPDATKAEEPLNQPEETQAELEDQSKVDEAPLASTNNQDAPTTAGSTTVEPKTEDASTPKSHQGTLTHLEQNRPYVYLQLVPDSEPIIERINELIDVIVQADKHEASYNVGDHVIAQFSEDDAHYRGRLESYSTANQTYSVYFLDYGNLDESVPVDRVFSYSEELENIEPQARGYVLDKIDENTWEKTVRSLIQGKINDTVEFTVLDEKACVIHLKVDYEEKAPVSHVEPTRTFQAQICAIEKDSFYIHRLLPDDQSRLSQMKTTLQTCARDRRTSGTWSVNDACLMSDEHDEFYRGQIVAIEENKFDVKCIDDGKILQNQTDEHLYVVPADEILAQAPLAHQCRLHAVDEAGQPEAIEQTVRPIQPTESVKITVENELDASCWSVILSRDNGEIVNDRYESDAHDNDEDKIKQQSDTDKADEESSSDSAIDDDDDDEGGEPNGPTNARASPTVDTPVEAEKEEEQVGETNTPNEEPELSSPVSTSPNTESGESDPPTTPKDEPSPSISSA